MQHMRDIFDDISKNQPLDPTESARRNMRPQLRRRFYSAVSVEKGPAGYGVLLDGRPVKTPARRTLAAPTEALAQALADEWEAQREMVDPAVMPLTQNLSKTLVAFVRIVSCVDSAWAMPGIITFSSICPAWDA